MLCLFVMQVLKSREHGQPAPIHRVCACACVSEGGREWLGVPRRVFAADSGHCASVNIARSDGAVGGAAGRGRCRALQRLAGLPRDAPALPRAPAGTQITHDRQYRGQNERNTEGI